MSLKVSIRTPKRETLVGRFELRGQHASALGVSDEKNVNPIVLDSSGAVLERPAGVASDAVNDVLDGRGRPVVLILHGYWGHKDYLYQKALAKALEYPSFRFDFRSNGESSHPERTNDTFKYFREDTEDLNVVIDVLLSHKWRIFAMVAHSRGAAIMYRAVFPRPHICRFLVNVSGRFDNANGFPEKYPGIHETISNQGYYEKVDTLRNGATRALRMTAETLELWKEWDTFMGPKLRALPRTLPVLTIHGTEDDVVPVRDSAYFATMIPNHTLHLVRGANHLFLNEHGEDLISTVTKWLRDQTVTMGSFYRAHCITPPVFGAGRSRIGKELAGTGADGGVPSSLVEGVQNFRDFGGYPVRDGRIVRWEFLYRCGKLNAITERGKKQLLALGVTHTIDLRSTQEVEREATPTIDSVDRISCPVFVDQDYSPAELAKRWKLYTTGGESGFAQAYMTICGTGAKAYALYLRHMLRTKQPAVLHCTAGKDRTGVFAALLLKFLEVDEDLIIRDYALTESLLFWSDEELRGLIEHSNGALTMDGARQMLSARAGAMRLFLEDFGRAYETVDKYYVNFLGMLKGELEELKELLVVQADQTCPPLPESLRSLL
ncbi:tyrosine phosphatase family-domain-containing protein [Cladochytrium replicatum]|nr:tyrosine phosphatase family-domain-containing protein [Cladochytrium replicatum]